MVNNAPNPQPQPNPQVDLINNILQNPDQAARKNALEQAIQNDTLDNLEALAGQINQHPVLKVDAAKLEEFKIVIKEKIEVLTQAMQIDQRLSALESRVQILVLLPELGPQKNPLQRATDKVIEIGGKMLTPFTAAGGWIGETAQKTYAWISNPDNRAWLGRTIKNFAMRRMYEAISTMGIGPMKAIGIEKLKEMDAVDAIWTVVDAERQVPPQNTIVFDGEFNKATWLRIPAEKRTPEKMQEMAQYFINEQRKNQNDKNIKLGMPEAPILVKMELLMDPEKAAEIAKTEQEEQEKKQLEELQVEIAKNLPNVEKVVIGTETTATKEGPNWSISISKEDIDQTTKNIKPNSKASLLVDALSKLSNAKVVTIENADANMQKKNGQMEIQISADVQGSLATINTLADKVSNGGEHIASVKLIRDVTLNNRIAWTPQNGVGNVECTEGMLNTLEQNFGKLRQTVTNTTPTQRTFFEWKNGNWEIIT